MHTATPKKTVHYDATTRDFAMYLGDEFVGYRATRQAAVETLDALVYDRLTRVHQAAPADNVVGICRTEPDPDLVEAGNAALMALQLEQEAAARRRFRARLRVEAERDAVCDALDELCHTVGAAAAARYVRGAAYVRAGVVSWADEDAERLWITRTGGHDHLVDGDGRCGCVGAGREGRRCWASAVAEAIALVRRRRDG